MENDEVDTLELAKRIVLTMLAPVVMDDRQPTASEVTNAANLVAGMLLGQGQQVDPTQLAKAVEADTAVFQEVSVGLSNDAEHEPWISQARAERSWDFWERYRRYTEDVIDLPRRVVRRLDRTTDEILGQIEDPRRPGQWRRAGLVIGQVQSGKTGQYIGLAAKAVDAGYGLIVILAGIHNDLRSQTQLRVDEGLLGFDTQYQRRMKEAGTKARFIGVGRLERSKRLDIASPTNSSETGDFGKKSAETVNFPLGKFPVVLVVKKHWKILEYVKTWVGEFSGVETGSGEKRVPNVPLLVIDDEADNASINTEQDPEADPTRTNGAIRSLMNTFHKAAYIGYTATPYANIYIDPTTSHSDFGADLFPESFIRTLPSPSNYFGPERVFGLQNENKEDWEVDPLPVVRHVFDSDQWAPPKHKSSFRPVEPLPGSLQRAIESFVLSCAARRFRGQSKVHNSMLIHVTRFTDVQEVVRDQVEDFVSLLADNLGDRYGKSADAMEQLNRLWKEDFVPTTNFFSDSEAPRITWEQVKEHILPSIRKIEVKTINGTSRDVLDYYDNRKTGLSVIAVGGQKLSRGLTLEGLTVSYYLRTSSTYDTLLQMGRWFGYRPKHEDLCRLYTSPELQAAYVEVTSATDELRKEIEEMAALGLTPKEFGLKVRTSSLGLAITAPNKMRSGTRVRISYSGEGPETTVFDLSPKVLLNNFEALTRFAERLDSTSVRDTTKKRAGVVWKGAKPAEITRFLNDYITANAAFRVRPGYIAKYIERCAEVGELQSWTVYLVGKTNPANEDVIANQKIGRVTRNKRGDDKICILRRVVSPADEQTGLYDHQIKAAQNQAAEEAKKNGKKKLPSRPPGVYLRKQRKASEALLLIYLVDHTKENGAYTSEPIIGFQVSFPESDVFEQTEYVVNSIWRGEDTEAGYGDVDGEDDL
ncbi:Z1 domain-containing protein [Umezawaea sp. NPDC059074]|uniref:Z1 domain-containing protein n=1 Tax=Umezawaea sp. NPDC059074 TaxID=3346716 RepID=UPI0036B8BBE8